jgi:hypothetical protein
MRSHFTTPLKGTITHDIFLRSVKIKQQFIIYMGAGGFQNIFCLSDEKENLLAQNCF